MPLVFVYGTLMRAGANHAVLDRLDARFVATATTREPRLLVDLGPYPALLPASRDAQPATARVSGEVWELDDSALRELDAFEGYPDLYTRERVALLTDAASDDEAGRELEAFVYVLARRPPAHARVISSGRYDAMGTVLPEGATPEQIETVSTLGPRKRARRRRRR
jgi:gamma-glutamylcyclotransferase (GGCT)/AIG2-like uncharacterized protein YtfP